MKYFNQLHNYICCIKRRMSSFKLSVWEDYMFVNFIVEPGSTGRKLLVSMPLNDSKKTVNLCRSSDDTIQMFIDRLQIKLNQAYAKKKFQKPDFANNISIKVDGITVSADSICGQVFEEEKTNITLHIKDNIVKVVVNAPIVKDLKLRIPPYEGLMLYPYAFDKGYNVSILDSKFEWYRIESKNEIKVANEIAYIPTTNDVNCCLKLVCNPCNERGQFGPKAEIVSSIVSKNIIETYPFERRLKEKPNNSFRVVSYNILAEEYTKTKEAKTSMYPYCSAEILASSYRNPLLLKELIAYNPDILCMQEVESNLFTRELNPLLKQYINMHGVFLRKTGKRNEGLSCFYSCDKFNLLSTFDFKLNDLSTVTMYCGTIVEEILTDELWNEFFKKQTVFQVVVLELISDTNQLFLVCNTHLISDPEGDSMRLLQALVELTIINQLKQNIQNDYPDRNVSVIFCGDFNSTPESGVLDLATLLLLPDEHNDVKIMNDLKNTLGFKMECAYDFMNVDYSNYTQTFYGLLDYIFFTKQHLELIQVLPMPPHDDVIQHVGLPSVLFPSDHLALIADLKVK